MGEPERIKSVVEKVIRKLKKRRVEPIRESWRTVFKEEIAGHSVPVSIRNGKLLVFVDSSVWLQHLTVKKRDILKKLKEIPSCKSVEEIHFRQGKLQ